MVDEQSKKEAPDNWWQQPLFLFMELSGWIAFPVIIAVFLGKWLDQKFETKPWLFLTTVAFAFTISIIGIVRSAVKSMKQIKDQKKDIKKQIKDGEIK